MKKILLLTAVFTATLVSAQNFTTYGLSGNAGNLAQNPGADPLTKFQLNFLSVQADAGMNMSAGTLFATTDLLSNLINSGKSSTDFNAAIGINLPSIGIKLGKNYLFAGTTLDVYENVSFDNSFAGFLKYGLADANGNYDPNYSGDFSNFHVGLDVVNSSYFGFQRTFLEEKLRAGITYNTHNYIAGVSLNTNEFSINSTANASTGMNELNVNYDFSLGTSNLLDSSMPLDSLNQFGNAVKFNTMDARGIVNYLTTSSSKGNSFGFGITYKPIDKLELQFSMNGLGAQDLIVQADVARSISGGAAINGFAYTSSVGDTIGKAVNTEVSAYTQSIQESLNPTLSSDTYEYVYKAAKATNIGVNYYLNKHSYVGAHYSSGSNAFRSYEYLGFQSLLFLGRNLQLKGSYYMAMDEVNADFIAAALQFRVTPLLQIYVGSSTVGDVATIADQLIQSGTPKIGAATQGINFSAGLSMSLFDSRFKKEKDEKKSKKKDNSTLTPAEKKAVEKAYEQSNTVKGNN
jgi:hypothetical protein